MVRQCSRLPVNALASFFAIISSLPLCHGETQFGIQVSDIADSYASGMIYDRSAHRIYITGVTYGSVFRPIDEDRSTPSSTSNCFLGIMQLPRQIFASPTWLHKVQLGTGDISHGCATIHVSDKTREIYVLGHDVMGESMLSPLRKEGSTSTVTYGRIHHLSPAGDIQGGYMIRSKEVQYPVAMDANQDSSILYVITLLSEDDGINPQFSENAGDLATSTKADLTSTGYLPLQYGSRYSVLLQSFQKIPAQDSTSSNLKETILPMWSRQFGGREMESVKSPRILSLSDNMLVMTGSTGPAETSDVNFSEGHREDSDGFIAVFDPTTGDLIRSRRIWSADGGDDRILGICRQEDSTDGNSASDVYMVGTSNGKIVDSRETSDASSSFEPDGTSAFLLKFNAETMEIVWVYQLGALHDDKISQRSSSKGEIHGIACSVSFDGELVYMAGTVKDGSTISVIQSDVSKVKDKSSGGDDTFLAQFTTEEGDLVFARQVGTSQDDQLASGEGLITTENGDAILLGNTRGSLMHERDIESELVHESEIFVLSFSRETGDHIDLIMEDATANSYMDDDNHEEIADHSGANDVAMGDSDSSTPSVHSPYNNNDLSDNGKTDSVEVVANIADNRERQHFSQASSRSPPQSQEAEGEDQVEDIARHTDDAPPRDVEGVPTTEVEPTQPPTRGPKDNSKRDAYVDGERNVAGVPLAEEERDVEGASRARGESAPPVEGTTDIWSSDDGTRMPQSSIKPNSNGWETIETITSAPSYRNENDDDDNMIIPIERSSSNSSKSVYIFPYVVAVAILGNIMVASGTALIYLSRRRRNSFQSTRSCKKDPIQTKLEHSQNAFLREGKWEPTRLYWENACNIQGTGNQETSQRSIKFGVDSLDCFQNRTDQTEMVPKQQSSYDLLEAWSYSTGSFVDERPTF